MTYNVFSGTLNSTQSISKLTYFCVHWMLNLDQLVYCFVNDVAVCPSPVVSNV